MKSRTKILIVIFMNIVLFTIGCSKKRDVSLEEIESNIVNTIKIDNMEKGNQKSLRKIYGINPDDLDEFIIYIPKSNMEVEEILILKVKNKENIDNIKENIEDRVDRQIKNFDGYGIEQVESLNEYKLKIKDNYILYAVSEKNEEIKDLFIKSINQ